MRNAFLSIQLFFLLVSCQHQLHFPVPPPAPVIPKEKLVTAIVITDPTETDYDSLVFRYEIDRTREVHYPRQQDSVTRTYYYDAAGRLSALEDDKAIYYTNDNTAMRINFQYSSAGILQQTSTDFKGIQAMPAQMVFSYTGATRQMITYDTAYNSAGFHLQWVNRIIYSTISSNGFLLHDSALFINLSAPDLSKTVVNAYSYGVDSSITSISKHIYFNHQLAEYGTVSCNGDRNTPAYKGLRRNLFRNLANWFEAGQVWQDDNYHLFPLPGGPYISILYKGYSASENPSPPYTLDYLFSNSYYNDQLNQSIVTYSLSGRGSSRYTNVIRYYYKE